MTLEEVLQPNLEPLRRQLVHRRRRVRHRDALSLRSAGAVSARRCAPYCTRPTTVEYRGACTESASPPRNSPGSPTRARPFRRPNSPAHLVPGCAAAPPVTTTPADSRFQEAGLLHVAHHQLEDLRRALVDDVREQFARDFAVALRDRARQLDDLAVVDHRLICAAVGLLQPLGVGLRNAEARERCRW